MSRQVLNIILGMVLILLLAGIAAAQRPEAPSGPGAVPVNTGSAHSTPPDSVNAPSACPALPAAVAAANFPDQIETEHFCLYYDGADTADHANGVISHIEAQVAVGTAEVAYDRYIEQFGFEPPPTDATGKRMYWIYRGDEPDIAAYLNFNNPPVPVSSCNGVSRTSNNVMAAWTGCFDAPEEQVFGVGAHELFHGVQIGHNGANETGWLMEGTARAMEDMIFSVLDNWSDAMSASFSFNQQANNYLDTTNKDLTAQPNRYDAALWWKFFTEQYGTTAVEPELGVDAMLALWEATETADDIAAINQALSNLNAGVDFHTAYRRFVLANWTKDLTLSSLPDASYYYIDELQVGNPNTYGPIVPTSGGILSLNNSAQWTDQNIARYGVAYYSATPGSDCPVATATISKDNGDSAFYHVVAEDGPALLEHTESNAQNWSQSFVNSDDLSRLVAIVGSLENSSTVDVSFSCADPVIDIQLPNNFAPAYVGSASDPGKFLVQLLVTNGAINAPVVAGLSLDDFRVEVNGIDALIVAGGFVQEQYWLQVQAPNQTADGTYHLEVFLEEPDTNNAIASDISANSVVYDPAHTDQALIIDRSGSMSESDKMQAARDAANFYIDVSREDDGLAVVPFNGGINPPAFDMQSVDDTVRDQAHSFVNGLVPNGSTSIGDGLYEAVGQRLSSTTGNPRCSFVLMSDGMENTAQYWADIEGDVVATGCPVTTLAFGPTSNETLLQTIAMATGGLPFYNDVSPSNQQLQAMVTPDEMALGLADTYEYIQARTAGRQRLMAAAGTTTFPLVEQVHPVLVDQSVSQMLFALDWNDTNMVMRLRLRRPDGVITDPATTPYTFVDGVDSAHLGWRISAPDPGVWEMLVTYIAPTTAVSAPYRVIAGGQTNLTVELLLPDRLGTSYLTGNSVPIYALVASDAPISDGEVQATVTAPNGNAVQFALYDDGAHDDGEAGDGLFGNWYTAVNQANVAVPSDEGVPEPAANDEGAYRVRVVVKGPTYQREALGAFAVLEGPDINGNSLPDPYEDEHGVDDPDADPDLDNLTTLREYFAGSNPMVSDTDDGGENDGSEVNHSQNPLDPSDDQIEAPEFFIAAPADDAAILHYDVDRNYERIALYLARDPAGPWTLYDADIVASGHMTCTYPCAANGQAQVFRLAATTRSGHVSAIMTSEQITPSSDPIPPQAIVIVNDGAGTTAVLAVTLKFGPVQGETQEFNDISQVLLSNHSDFGGATWQPFAQGIPWPLESTTRPGELAKVYARFRDRAGNESTGVAIGYIVYQPPQIFLPILVAP